jgi:anaerobic magnesium-protoporphyrin IX monomethyl ester cyclase
VYSNDAKSAGRGLRVNYLLINLPLTDPTAPYHSISYLVGAASAAGYTNFSCLDANIVALNHLAQADQVADLIATCREIRSRLECKYRLTRGEQLLYRYVLKGFGMEPDSVVRAIDVLKDPDSFYDYPSYRQAVLVVKRWLAALSVHGFPGEFCDDFSFNLTGVGNLASIRDLTNAIYLEQLMRPLSSYFAGPFTQVINQQSWDVIGLSANYVSQLPCAIYATQLIRSLCPKCVLCLGGTEISDDVKCLGDPRLIWALFPQADALVVGEGETAFIEILDAVASQKQLPEGRPGILLRSKPETAMQPLVRYENVATLASPRYDIWDWDQYWAPEPMVLYSPTRGCYWNKCTFCDYGLNTDSPTSPSRERPIELALADLKDIVNIARTIYLAVDAISPHYLRRWAKGIRDSALKIRWSAELRIERSFLKGLVDEIRQAGCVALSFGYESGSQRILDLINKGVKIDKVPAILREIAKVDIGVQMMGFVGFPGETLEEAYATFDFLERHRRYWTLAGIGDFVLTKGSIVAKRYQDFGITEIGTYPGDDIIRALYSVGDNGRIRELRDMRTAVIDRIAKSLRRVADDRPFVGGIDSTHSILYFAKYGPSLVPTDDYECEPVPVAIETLRYRTPLQGVEQFLDLVSLQEYRSQEVKSGKEVSIGAMMGWLSEYPDDVSNANWQQGEVLEIYPSGQFIAMTSDETVDAFEGSEAYQILKKLLLAGRGVA